jgi:hypothetical protein
MVQSEKYIAFLDILGFKDLVTNNSHSDLVRKIQNLLLPSIEHSLSNGKRKIVDRNGVATSIADIDEIKIHSLTISDSIMFWTDDCSLGSFMQIALVVRNTLESGFYTGLPMRGAISLGDLSFTNLTFGDKTSNFHSLLIGRGLVEAYKLENKQEWAGCIVDECCIKKVIELEPGMKVDSDWFLSKKLIIKYEAPYKGGNSKKEYVIRWLKEPQYLNEVNVRKNFSAHKKNILDENTELKIQNTLKFIEYCQLLQQEENEENQL